MWRLKTILPWSLAAAAIMVAAYTTHQYTQAVEARTDYHQANLKWKQAYNELLGDYNGIVRQFNRQHANKGVLEDGYQSQLTRKEALEKELETLTTQNVKLTSEVESIQQRNRNLTQRLQGAESDLSSLRQVIDRLQKTKAPARESTVSLAQYERLQKRYDTKSRELTALEKKYNQVRWQRTSTPTQGVATATHNTLVREHEELKRSYNGLLSQFKGLKSYAILLQADNRELQANGNRRRAATALWDIAFQAVGPALADIACAHFGASPGICSSIVHKIGEKLIDAWSN